jgi:hypothetical protein
MTRSDFIERRESGVPAGSGRNASSANQSASAMTKRKLQLIVTAAISLLIGISIGIIAVHLLSATAPGVEGLWRHYVRL